MSGWGTARILNTCNRSGHLDFGGSRFLSVNSEFAASSFYKVGPYFFMSNKLLVSPKESHDFSRISGAQKLAGQEEKYHEPQDSHSSWQC